MMTANVPYDLDSQPQPTDILGPSSLSENIDPASPDSVSNVDTQISSSQKCSVRGCKRNVTPDSGTKMCEVCRGRHRIYATTKRAKRKLEKAAVVNMGRMSDQVLVDNSSASVTNPDPGVVVPDAEVSGWMSTQAAPSTTATTWDNTAIDPQLFPESISEPASATASVNTRSPMDFMGLHISSYPPVPYVSSTSSELAGALTLPTAASASTATIVNEQKNTSYYRPRLPDGTLIQSDLAMPSVGQRRKRRRTRSPPKVDKQEEEDSFDENENKNNEESQDSIIPTADDQAGDAATNIQDAGTVSAVDGPTRFCSVKGCKAVIPASYAFKMCPPCRVRYRTYGITKRAKWRAERAAFDRELADLRSKEDERRKLAGERSLSESPDELHAWELSILDEEVSLPPEVLAMLAVDNKPNPNATNGNVNTMNLHQNMPMIHPTNAIDTPHSVSPYPHLNNPLVPPTFQLPARMCTVSHCHKLLPGLYRYKRCVQHRLQNRYHSKLKRCREKVVKAEGPTGDEECLVVDTEGGEKGKDAVGQEGKRRRRREKENASEMEGGREAADEDGSDAEKSPHLPIEFGEKEKKDDEKKSRKLSFRCTSDGCCNLLSPEIRWRNCEICRAKERVAKREKRVAEQAAAKEVERLKEIVRAMEANGGVSGLAAEGQSGGTQASLSGVAMEDEDTEESEGEGDIGEEQAGLNSNEGADMNADMANDEGESDIGSNEETGSDVISHSPRLVAQTTSAPTATKGPEPVTLSSGSKGGTYHSIFRTTVAPSTSTNKPTILTANLAGMDGLTFKEYQPKATSSTMGRPLGQNPELSVQVFKDLLAPKEKQANTGLVGPSSYYVYQSTPPPPPARAPPVFAPTVPRTPPFVYQPPGKKARTKASENHQAQEREASEQGESVAAASSGPVTSGPETIHPPSSTASITTSTKRKRPSRAAPRPQSPAQPQPQLPMQAYPYSNVPSSQYPYPYYVPPYGTPPYGIPPPQPPASASTLSPSTAAHLSSASPYPPQPYYYSYAQHYGPPPPGYIYAPPGYAPTQYTQYQQPMYAPQPGTYALPYGYPKDAEYGYASNLPQPKEYSFVVPRQRQPKRKRANVDAIMDKAASSTATATAPSTLGVVPAAANGVIIPMTTTEGTPTVNGNGGIAGNDTIVSSAPTQSASSATQSRPCGNKTCNRTIAPTVAGTLCEKCRLRLKKRQAKTKQRFKLEPRKSVLGIVRRE